MIRLALCFWLIASVALAADVDPAQCHDIDDITRAWVPARLQPWLKFEHAVQACPAHSKNHRFLFWIITVNLLYEPAEAHKDSAYYPLDPGGFTRACTPNPYIIDANNRELGRISDAFPTGGFGHVELFFSQWVNDFPHRITVKVFGAGVEGNYTAPRLQWNTQTQHYDQIGRTICDDPPAIQRQR